MTELPKRDPRPSTGYGQRDLIRIKGDVVNRSLAETDPEAWLKKLQSAYIDKQPPQCLCNGMSKPIPMSIAKAGNTYLLKRWPKTGYQHHTDCESHGGISEAAMGLYTKDAISERPDGKVEIALSVPLSTVERLDTTLDELAAPPRPRKPGVKSNSITLRGFLNMLWEEAGIHTWSPGMKGKRTLGRVYWRLRSSLEDRIIGRDDAAMRVLVPITTRFDEQAEQEKRVDIERRFTHMAAQCGETRKGILIVVGEVFSIYEGAKDAALRLKGMPDNMPIWVPRVSMERLRDQWPNMMQRFERKKGGVNKPNQGAESQNRLFIIAGVQRSDKGNLQWRFGSAMETTEHFIPVDSQFEAVIAQALVEQGRRFRKPMRYDGVEAMFSDFILTDGPKEIPMEIYGFSSPEYNKRKNEKIAAYEKTGEPFWHWDLSKDKVPPPFPLIPAPARRNDSHAAQ